MKLFPGAKIHIWTKGSITWMRITNNQGGLLDTFDSFAELLTILSDTKRQMGCDLRIEIEGNQSYECY